MRRERQRAFVQRLRVVVFLARLHAMQEVEQRGLVGAELGTDVLRQPLLAPFLRGLVGGQPEPADHSVDLALVVLAEERLAERHGLVAKAGAAAVPAVVVAVDEHGRVAERAERLPVVVILAGEIGVCVVALAEKLLRRLLEPQPGGAVLHDVFVALQPMPLHVPRRHQRIRDRAEPVQRQRAGGVDLLLGLLLAGRVVILVVERIARGRQDELRDLLPLTRKETPACLVLREFTHDRGNDLRLAVGDLPRLRRRAGRSIGDEISGRGVWHRGPSDRTSDPAGGRRPPSAART